MLIINKYVFNLLWNAFYCQRVIVDTMIHLKLKSPVGDFNFYQSNIWTEYLYVTRLVMRAELLKCWSTKVKHFPTEWLIFSALKHLQVRVWPRPPGSYLLSDVRRRRNVPAPHLNESWSQDESAGLQITWETVFSCSSSKKNFLSSQFEIKRSSERETHLLPDWTGDGGAEKLHSAEVNKHLVLFPQWAHYLLQVVFLF